MNRWIGLRSAAVLVLAAAAVTAVLWTSRGSGRDGAEHTGNNAGAAQTAWAAESGPKPGAMAPAFTLNDGEGAPHTVGGPAEKPVLLNFWASWCDPCKQEAPDLNALADKYRDSLDMYGVNVTSYDYKPNAERFVRKYGLSFPVLFDLEGDVYDMYRGSVFPTNVLIRPDGIIQEVIIGVLPKEELEDKLKALIAGH